VLIEIEHRGEQRVALIEPRYGDITRTPLPDLPKPWAGVEVQGVTAQLARALGLKEGGGFRITRVYPAAPLALAGARVGDIVVAIQGKPLKPANETDSQSFHERVGELDGDEAVKFGVWRDGALLALEARLSAAPLPAAAQRSTDVARLDAVVRDLSFYDRVALHLPETARGVIVEQVQSGSPAGLAHLQVGDAVFTLGGERVPDVATFRAAFERALKADGTSIAFEIQRGAETRLLFLDKSWLPEGH
jgi:serine protease Do